MCMVGDEDYWSFYNEYRPKARKEHVCGECGRTIAKGEHYVTQGGLSEAGFEWNHTCAHCDAASEWLISVCDGYIFGRREEDFTEHVIGHEKELRSAPLTRLLRWMRADWQDRDGNLRPIEDVWAVASEAIAAYRRQYERRVAA